MRKAILQAWKQVIQQDGFAVHTYPAGELTIYDGCAYYKEGKHCVVGKVLHNSGVSNTDLQQVHGNVNTALLKTSRPTLFVHQDLLQQSQRLHDSAARESVQQGLNVVHALTYALAHAPRDEASDILREALNACPA